jgi:hypothetical protein
MTAGGANSRTICPLCGADNGCGMERGESHCWCFETEISPAILAQVPAAALGVACICRNCAQGRPPNVYQKVIQIIRARTGHDTP